MAEAEGRQPAVRGRSSWDYLTDGQNDFLLAHSESAPAAYPEVHHLTSPMRKAAREAGLADYVNLWAGQAYPLTATAPAADLVRDLWAQAQAALSQAAGRYALPG